MRDRLQIRIDPELLSNFKTLCYFSGETMTDVRYGFVEGWIVSAETRAINEFGLTEESLDLLLRRTSNEDN